MAAGGLEGPGWHLRLHPALQILPKPPHPSSSLNLFRLLPSSFAPHTSQAPNALPQPHRLAASRAAKDTTPKVSQDALLPTSLQVFPSTHPLPGEIPQDWCWGVGGGRGRWYLLGPQSRALASAGWCRSCPGCRLRPAGGGEAAERWGEGRKGVQLGPGGKGPRCYPVRGM